MFNKKNIKTMLHIFFFISVMTLVSSCATTTAYYSSETELKLPSKNKEAVLLLSERPQGLVFKIGQLSVNGNEVATQANVIEKAKQKTAEVGGDLLVQESAGVESQSFYVPGFSTYQSNSSWNLGGQGYSNSYQINGSGNQYGYGYSIGPSIQTRYFPWGHFSVWAKAPWNLGIILHEIYVVGILPDTDAKAAGISIGDQLYAINGYQIYDRELIKHFFNIQQGDKVTLTLYRNGHWFDCIVTALPA